MADKGESGDNSKPSPKGKDQDDDSCLGTRSCVVQFILIFVPLALLTTAVIVLAIMLDDEIKKRDKIPVVPSTATPLPTTKTTTLIPTIKTTTKAPGPTVCSSESCVAAAGAMLAAMDKKADPCVDFYQYTCGGYEREQNIPSGYNKYSSFDKARNLVSKNLKHVLETPPTKVEAEARQKTRRYYAACLKVDEIAKKGPAALVKMTEDMGGFYMMKPHQPFPADWSLDDLLEKRNKYSMSGFFSIGVAEDNKNVKQNIIQITQGGLGLGSGTRDYYLNKNVTDDAILVAYADLLATYAHVVLGHEPMVDMELARDVIRFEQELAKIQLSNSAIRDPTLTYNKQNIEWLQTNAPFIDWLRFVKNVFNQLPEPIAIEAKEPVIIYTTSYITNMSVLIKEYLKTSEKRRALHNYVLFQSIMDLAPKFGGELQEASDRFQAIFSGKKGTLPIWQTCSTETDSRVGFPLGAMYIEEYFTAVAKNKTIFVIDSVSNAFRKRVEDVNWMDDETREKALAKVDTLVYEAAYPDWVMDDGYLNKYYAHLQVTDDYVENQFHAYSFQLFKEFSTLRTGRDSKAWLMTPQTVNAYYNPPENKFVVPAGILTPPFFYLSPDIPIAINFGAIGVVVGHEISHGFDDKGSQYDKEGNLANWWTEETRTKFDDRSQCLVDQYGKFEAEGLHVDGHMTLGENIGDNGGLHSSYQAYNTYVKPSEVSTLVGMGLTPDQLFFVAYAQVWCSLYTPESMRKQILQDVHSPGPFRVNGPVANSLAFAKAFNCPFGKPMHPAKKCIVW